MARYCKLVKNRTQKAQMGNKSIHSMDASDDSIIRNMYKALQNMDSGIAQEIISCPNIIFGLVDVDDPRHQIRCVYALHAMLIVLCTNNYKDILNQMSDNNIDTLKRLISVAKKFERPSKEMIENALKDRKGRANTLAQKEKLVNAAWIQSLHVYQKVEDMWDDATTELQKWDDAVANFQREIEPEETDTDNDAKQEVKTMTIPELMKELDYTSKDAKQEVKTMTIPELMKELGYTSKNAFFVQKCRLLKMYPERAQEIKSWFPANGRGKLFDATHLQEYKQLCESMLKHGKKVKKKQKTAKSDDKRKMKQPKNLADLKAFDAYVMKLKDLYEKMSACLDNAENECAKATEDAWHAKSTAERAEYLNRAMKANENVALAQQKADDAKDRLDKANKLLHDRQAALDALRLAEEQIASMMAQTESMSE